MAKSKKNSLNRTKRSIELDRLMQEETQKEKRTVVFGVVYSIGIIFIMLIIISFLFLAERNPEEITGPEGPDVVINEFDYLDFFINDTTHYPDGFKSVSGERCGLCHAEDGEKIIYQLRSFKLYDAPQDETATRCYKCHVDPKHKVQSPYQTCSECHYQEGHNPKSLSFNNILGRLGSIENSFCIECHEKECTELKKVGHTHEDLCSNCHNDHKIIPGCMDCHSPNTIGPYHKSDSSDFEICTDCHKGGAHERPVINDEMDCSICHSDIYQKRLEDYGGRHFTNSTLGKCDSCHVNHKEYPSCRDCHGAFPEHLNGEVINDPNSDCTICHEGGAHDSRVTYKNYSPVLGDDICEVCHETEYDVYYQQSTPGEIAIYGTCLDCHEEHNANIKVPHITPGNFLNCTKCHEEYNGPKTMHIISKTSFNAFPYTDIENKFCSNCHSLEYQSITKNSTERFEKFYGGCTECHVDHKSIEYPHFVESPYDDCKKCHKTYDSIVSIHNPINITYSDVPFKINNEFCSSCHEFEYNRLINGTHNSRSCTDCHGEHNKISVNFDKCTLCHTGIPASHDEELVSCPGCHDTSLIHSIS